MFSFQDAAETLEIFFLISFISIALLKSGFNSLGLKTTVVVFSVK